MSITFTLLSLSLSSSWIVHHLDLDFWRMIISISLQTSSDSDKHPNNREIHNFDEAAE
jgi:hypothetical protein